MRGALSMKNIYLVIFLMSILIDSSLAQSKSKIGLAAYGTYSSPVAGLSEWFEPALNYGAGIGGNYNDDWYFEGLIDYCQFEEEYQNSQATGRADLFLQHLGFIFNTKYRFASLGILIPYLNFGIGLYYWKGSRGAIEPDDSVEPPIPYIEQLILEEWNFGFRTGLGVELQFSDHIALDLCGYYRFIVGELWPTLQPHVELENVSGFQTINLEMMIRYYF
jgi:opacity protein-like surface antigen